MTHVLEWSRSQNSMHIHTVEECMDKNISAYIGNEKRDYIPVCFGTRETCERALNDFMERLTARGGISSRNSWRSFRAEA